MATLRKANAYSKRKVTPYTRKSKKRTKSFIKAVPAQKIVKFDMGKTKEFQAGKFPYKVVVVSEEPCQIRHNALEACRQYLNKKLDKATNKNYFFKIVPYPHHVQRENKMLTGAGADRMQTGMQLAFGKSAGKAAIVKKGTKLFIFGISTPKEMNMLRSWVKDINPKLPCKTKTIIEKQPAPVKAKE